MLKLPDPKPIIKVGDKIRLAKLTFEEADDLDGMAEKAGWGSITGIIMSMMRFFGTEVTINNIFQDNDKFNIKEDNIIYNWTIAWIEQNSLVSSRSNGNSKCLICGSTGYAGFFSFECDNNDCQNRRK